MAEKLPNRQLEEYPDILYMLEEGRTMVIKFQVNGKESATQTAPIVSNSPMQEKGMAKSKMAEELPNREHEVSTPVVFKLEEDTNMVIEFQVEDKESVTQTASIVSNNPIRETGMANSKMAVKLPNREHEEFPDIVFKLGEGHMMVKHRSELDVRNCKVLEFQPASQTAPIVSNNPTQETEMANIKMAEILPNREHEEFPDIVFKLEKGQTMVIKVQVKVKESATQTAPIVSNNPNNVNKVRGNCKESAAKITPVAFVSPMQNRRSPQSLPTCISPLFEKKGFPLFEDVNTKSHDGRQTFSTTEEHLALSVINKYQKSVGIMKWSNEEGSQNATVLRLGSKYIITNYHVVHDIYKDRERKYFDLKEVKVYFNYTTLEGNECWRLKCVNNKFLSTFYSSTRELDYIILELENTEGRQLPPSVSKNISSYESNSSRFFIMGHPHGSTLRMDVRCVSKVEETQSLPTLTKMQTIASADVKQATDKRRMLYHTSMFHGSSGSAVVSFNGDLLGIHTRGFYKNDSHRSMFEQCVTIQEIRIDILRCIANIDENSALRDVYKDLFPNQSDDLMEF